PIACDPPPANLGCGLTVVPHPEAAKATPRPPPVRRRCPRFGDSEAFYETIACRRPVAGPAVRTGVGVGRRPAAAGDAAYGTGPLHQALLHNVRSQPLHARIGS